MRVDTWSAARLEPVYLSAQTWSTQIKPTPAQLEWGLSQSPNQIRCGISMHWWSNKQAANKSYAVRSSHHHTGPLLLLDRHRESETEWSSEQRRWNLRCLYNPCLNAQRLIGDSSYTPAEKQCLNVLQSVLWGGGTQSSVSKALTSDVTCRTISMNYKSSNTPAVFVEPVAGGWGKLISGDY